MAMIMNKRPCQFFTSVSELGFYETLNKLSKTEHIPLLIQWYEFCSLAEEDVLFQQGNTDDDDTLDDVDGLATDVEFLKQMAPYNNRLLCSFVQTLLKHQDMNSLSG